MFGIGSSEFIVIIVVAVLVLGPEHLPRIMRTVTKVMSDFRRISTELQRVVNLESFEAEEIVKKSKGTKKRGTAKTTRKKPSSGKSSETTTKAASAPAGPSATEETSMSEPLISNPSTVPDTEQQNAASDEGMADSSGTAGKDEHAAPGSDNRTSPSEPAS